MTLSSGLILCSNVYNAVGVNIECNLNLGHPFGSGWNAGKLEFTEKLVVGRKLTLSLKNLDLNGRLIICGRGEDLQFRLNKHSQNTARKTLPVTFWLE